MKDNYLKLFGGVAVSLLLMTIIYPLILSHFISLPNDKGVFGDSFGALNAVFSALALSGVIVSIYMQRNEMGLQRDEMISSRYEYKHNRITNLVYYQLQKYEKSLELFKIKYHNEEPSGNNAIYFLDKNLKHLRNYEKDKQDKLQEALKKKDDIIHNLFILASSKSEITTFIISSYNCISALNIIIDKSDLDDEDKNELRSIFINNVGIITPSVLETIDTTVDFLGQFFRELDIEENQLKDIRLLMDIFLYIDEILEFLSK